MGSRIRPRQTGAAMKAAAKSIMAGLLADFATELQRIMQMKPQHHVLAGRPLGDHAKPEKRLRLALYPVKRVDGALQNIGGRHFIDDIGAFGAAGVGF